MTNPEIKSNSSITDDGLLKILNKIASLSEDLSKYTINIDHEISKKDDEVLDLLHILELMDLPKKDFDKTAEHLKDVVEERRNYKNIKMILTQINKDGFNIDSYLSESKNIDVKKLNLYLDDGNRYYNLRSDSTQKFLEDLLDRDIDKDFIKKHFSEDSYETGLAKQFTEQIKEDGYTTMHNKTLTKKPKVSNKPLNKKEFNKELFKALGKKR